MPDGSFADSMLGPRAGSTDCVVLDVGTPPVDPRAFTAAIRLVLAGQSGELARDRNGICYRVDLERGDGSSRSAILKIPRPGPQRTNPETTFAWEARILASLPAAGIPGAPALLGRVAHGDTHFLFLEDVPGNHPDPRAHPLDARHLRALLEHFHAMDIRGLMHYDLKSANILIDGAQAGFIDYEFARFRSHLNAYAPDSDAFCADFNVSINPFFPARSNVANFEFRALDRYLRDAAAEPATADALLNDWLRGKSGYHRQMAAFLARLQDTSAELMAITSGIPAAEARARLGAAAEFEALLANLLAQPGVAVSRVERQLMAYRCAVFERHAVEAARLRAIIQAGIGAARARAATLPEAYCRAIARVLELVGRSIEDAPG